MYKDKKENAGINGINPDNIKEVSVRKYFPKPKNNNKDTEIEKIVNFLYCDPPEVILQNIEKNKMYEVPVRIYNISTTSKRISIKPPINKNFKVDYDKKNKNSQIAPGLYIEMLIIYESDKLQDESDRVVIVSENNLKIELLLRAHKPKALVHYEPLINLGFVPVNTKKSEIINFLNDGTVDTKIELKLAEKNSELNLEPSESFILPRKDPKSRHTKKSIKITYEPKETNNLHEKIEVIQTNLEEEPKNIGYIEIIATSVYQQLSVVFEEGGGPTTEINFGMLYFGQKKECSAFLVNNGPKEIAYKFFFHPDKKPDKINSLDESNFESTPEQAGIEMTQRILSALPLNGFVKPYTQIPIKFLCKTKIPEKTRGWRGNICQEYEYNMNSDKKTRPFAMINNITTFSSTAAIKFEEAVVDIFNAKDADDKISRPISVYMEVKAIHPDLTLDKTMLNFWECKLHDQKIITIKIRNENEDLPIDFNFNKVPHFTIKPNSGIIYPNSEFPPIIVIFHPENYGNFSNVLVLKYVNNMYEIPIRLLGVCRGVTGVKKSNLHKNDSENALDILEDLKKNIVPPDKAQDFTIEKKVHIDKNAYMRRMYEKRMKKMVDDGANEEIIKNFGKQFENYEFIHEQKLKSNKEIRSNKSNTSNNNFIASNSKSRQIEHLVIDDRFIFNENKITLLDILMNDRNNRCESPKLRLPSAKEELWVVKPIGKYEPTTIDETVDNMKINLDPDIKATEKSLEKVSKIPKTHKEKKDCEMDLDGIDLQKIQIGTKGELEFGEVFIKSEMVKTFWMRNNLRTHIFVQLETSVYLELERTYPKSMVIPPSTTLGFNIVLYSKEEKKKGISFPLKYIINYKHAFNLRISASFVFVHLEPTTTLQPFSFKSEKYDRDHVEMSVKQKYVLYNGGNAPANIKWDENKVKSFRINPMSCSILPKQEFPIEITFTPLELGSKTPITDELKCNIENGIPITIPVSGYIPPVQVRIVNIPDDTVDFGNVHIGVAQEGKFYLKNETPKVVTAYWIKNLNPILRFEEDQGYLERNIKTISVFINSNTENREYYEEIEISIRGGARLTLKLKACIVQPDVFIEQPEFNFGNVPCFEQLTKTLTFRNNSPLDAHIKINLDNQIQLREFKIRIASRYNGEKDHMIKVIEKNKVDLSDIENVSLDDEELDDESRDGEISKIDLREFIVMIPGTNNKNKEEPFLDLDFTFCPTSPAPNLTKFDFFTNFRLAGGEECRGLQKKVTYCIINSAVTLTTSTIQFKKTFIYGADLRFDFQEIKMGNSRSCKIKWEFLTDELDKEGVFSVKDKQGILSESVDAHICSIQFSFCPQTKQEYKRTVVLITKEVNRDGIELSETEERKNITLMGEGAHPRLYFDKRELILPVVPLGMESIIRFKIKNEGYENAKIRHEMRNEMGLINCELKYLDENVIGYMKNELRMELKFISNKPLSFTFKLVFLDEEDHEAIIMVAGTADNCLFTNYSFLQRFDPNSCEFVKEETTSAVIPNISLKMRNDLDNGIYDEINDDIRSEINSTFQGSSVNTRSVNGYTKVRKNLILSNCKILKKYIRMIYPSTLIKNFPDDVMKDNGDLLFEVIKILTGREPPGRVTKYDNENKKPIILRNQYFDVIRYLQEQGAFLNTVFPEYLLDYVNFIKYIRSDTSRLKILEPNWEKRHIKSQWEYQNRESWTLIMYQILKIFYLSRINPKTYPLAIRHLNEDIYEKYKPLKFPQTQSNVFSNSELILLRWLNANYEHVNPNITKNCSNFSSDMKDNVFLSAVILAYFPKAEEMNKSKKNKTSSEAKILSPQIIIQTLKDYGVNVHIKSKQLEKLNAREIVHFLIMLYQNLQHFIPKQTIVFSCILGDSVIKSVELKNPALNRKIEYEVKTEGSNDFLYQGNNDIKIDPGKEVEYQITFKSRLSQRAEACIYFINKGYGWQQQAAPLVYKLISEVTGRRSIGDPYVIPKPILYKKNEFKINLKCPFDVKGDFEMRLIQQRRIQPIKREKRGKPQLKPVKQEERKEENIYRVFQAKGEDGEGRTVVRLDPESSKEIMIYFLPVDLEDYECHIVFVRDSIGEFQITVYAKAELPSSTENERWNKTCYVDEVKEFDLEVKLKNKYLDDAISQLKLINPIVNSTSLTITNTNPNANSPNPIPITSGLTTNNQNLSALKRNYSTNNNLNNNPNGFSVESLKPSIFQVINSIIYPNNFNESVSLQKNPNPNPNKSHTDFNNSLMNSSAVTAGAANKIDTLYFKVKFCHKTCQILRGEFIIRNLERANDIRVYELIVDVKPKNIFAKLEFICPVKETITQKIPIYNGSDVNWIIKGELTGHHNNFFRHDLEKKIPRKSQGEYLLTFAPTERIDVKGLLVLTNSHTKEVYNYELEGKADDPLAEEIFVINCRAKELVKKQIKFENPSDRDIVYTVETDLPEIISGAQSFTLRGQGKLDYEISIKPILGKTYFGKITFTDEKKNYKWWTIKIIAEPLIQQQTINLRTCIRKVLYVDISVDNPTNEFIIFHVQYDGEALFGATELRAEPGKPAIYRLNFSPLKVGHFDGELKLLNEYVGEFIYKLKLISEENPIISPEILESDLGKSTELVLILENPINEEVEISYNIQNNKKLFQIIPDKIVLPAFQGKEIIVKYTPSTLDIEEDTLIVFESNKIGKWIYNIRGKGIKPKPMETTIVNTFVGGITSGAINFRNPLNEKIFVNVELKCDQWPHTFGLLNKKEKYGIDPFRHLLVNFTFSPQILTKYYADIFIYINSELYWQYPIEGITEVKSKGIDFIFKTKAKKLLEQKINLDLSNLPDKEINREDFEFHMKIKDEKYKNLVLNKCLIVEDDKGRNTDLNQKKLSLNIKFYPLRPFKTDCELILSKISGGQWIYNIILEATEPDPDDIIHIQSSLGKISHVSFKLQNIFTKNSKYVAYFSHDSSSEFSISPREGVLAQSGREGTTFLISYLPVEYGKVKIGKLIIETDEIQWIFEVRGNHLDYKPPEVKTSNLLKLTKATITRNQINENGKSDSIKRRIKEIHTKDRQRAKSDSRSRSRSRSKTPKN